MERLRKILTNGLLAFVLVSIGFALGTHSAKSDRSAHRVPEGNGHQVAVFYLHSTFRCVTCNTIEGMTRELLDDRYSRELAAGTMRWIEDDFQENEGLARQFDVAASCVVVAELENGIVTHFSRLDDVWTLIDDPEAFRRYISDAIDGYLERMAGEA